MERSPSTARPVAEDATGEATLELFRENDAYTRFLWSRLSLLSPRPFEGSVLEVGCGIGNLTRILLGHAAVKRVKTIDMEPAYVARVLEQAGGDGRLEGETARAEEYCPAAEAGAHDFIVSTNVIEHVEDHVRALSNFHALLAPGGIALVLVPAHPSLYSDLDRNLSHFRRYSRESLLDVSARAGLDVLRMRHFNPLGAFGWWLNGKVLRRGMLPSGQLSLYTRFAIPISRLLDRWNPFPVGVSLIAALARAPR